MTTNLVKQVQDGERARAILEDPMVVAAFDDIEAAIVEQWKELPTDSHEEAIELKRRLWAFNQFRQVFTSKIYSGNMAAKELTLREKAENAFSTLKRAIW